MCLVLILHLCFVLFQVPTCSAAVGSWQCVRTWTSASIFVSVVASVVFCFRLPAQYAIVRYQKDDNYGITSCNWLHENHTMTYWPKNECNVASWLKSRKWMTDVRKHFKAYEVEVVKYAGVLPLFFAVICVGDRLFSNEHKCVLNS